MQKTFQQYLNDCSFLFQKAKAVSFQNQYYDRVVKWKGRVKSIGTAELYIILDPMKTMDEEPDMTLRLLAKRIQKSADKIQVGGDLSFRAQLLSFKGLNGPTIEGMLAKRDMPKSEDLPITYKEFDQQFGMTPECNAHVAFENKWQGETVKFTGTITSVEDSSTESDCVASAKLEAMGKPELRIEGDFTAVAAATPEPIVLNIPAELSTKVAELRMKAASKTPVVLSVVITGRTESHELRLVSVLDEAPALVTVPSSFHSAAGGRKTGSILASAASAARSSSRGSHGDGSSSGRSMSPTPYGATTSHSPFGKTSSTKRSPSALRLQAMMEEQKRKEEQDRADAERRMAMVNRIRRSTSPNPYLEESVTPPPPP